MRAAPVPCRQRTHSELYTLHAAARANVRNTDSREVCACLLAWLQTHRGPTSLSIHDAVNYTLKFWDRLTRFLDDAAILVDNTTTERAFRRPVIGRNNYFGAKARSGTFVAATFFSLLETCRLHDVNFTAYLTAACRAALDGRTLYWLMAQVHWPMKESTRHLI